MTQDEIRQECWNLVFRFFHSKMRAGAWFATKNDMLGGISPREMIEMGNGEKLLAWIKRQIENN